MKDFASFTGAGVPQEFLSEAQSIAEQMDGKSEAELLRNIYARAVEGKRAGTLTNSEIDAFVAQFAPMLDAGKRKKLYKVAEEIKRM